MRSFDLSFRLPWLAAIVLLLFISCKEQKKGNPGAAAAPLQVKAMILQPGYYEDLFMVNANLLPYEQTELKAPVSGNVLGIYFREGEKVHEGQSLIHIDDRVWKARLKGLEAQLEIAKSDSARNEALIEVQGVSQETVDKSNAQIQELQAQIEELEVNISLANVRAPFTGRVGMRDFSVGAYLSQGSFITSIVQSDRMKVDFDIPSRNAANVKLGEKVNIVIQSDTVQATVYAINPQIDPNSRTIKVRCEMSNPSEKYLPHSFVQVIIPINADENALVLPTAVIIPSLNSQTVFVYQAGKVYRKAVELGSRTDVEVQVLKGLNPGDTIIMTGLLEVKDNMPVVISELVKGPAL
jgi:membrane fusion protein (multidrug efflux system)